MKPVNLENTDLIQLGKLLEPLSEAQFDAIPDFMCISAEISVSLETLIDANLESLNDIADAAIIGENSAVLSDISYKITGCIPGTEAESENGSGNKSGSVYITVTAEINKY